MKAGRNIRIGIDVGGTFTDFALLKDGEFHTTKILTNHQAPEEAIMTGLAALMGQTGSQPADIHSIIHGTTLATNAIIENKGAKVAMLTTAGFRDVLELGTESRFDQYDLNLVKPKPLVPRHLRFSVAERLAADGSELLPLDLKSIESIAEEIQKHEVESVAICFLHSFVDSRHEERAKEALQKYLPEMYISLSSRVSPEIREYERFSTTTANAYVQPLIDTYLQGLEQNLTKTGYDCPLFMFLSNGGLAELQIARQFPVRLVESGPAGGAVFASHVARSHGESHILSFDMGGTTAKICLIDDAMPQKANIFEMARVHRFKQGSGLPAKIPVIEMVEIGAGGGSIARVDNLGRITTGPDSAGSEPGPACYGLGGANATVSDADFVLGRLESEGFADGSMSLNKEAAEQAINNCLAEPLKMAVPLAAFGVAEIVEEDMANAAREHATENGKSLAHRSLVAFGGAAPIHALTLAGKLGISRVIVPASAGVGSAVGFLLAPVSFELSRSCHVRMSNFNSESLNSLFEEMSKHAHGIVSSGTPGQDTVEVHHAQMRYVGQGYNISVELPLAQLNQGDADEVISLFNSVYRKLYNKLHDGVDIDIVGVTVSVSASLDSMNDIKINNPSDTADAEMDHLASLFDSKSGSYEQVNVYLREELRQGQGFTGPSLIRDKGTTIMVPAGYDISVADNLSIVIDRR